VDGPGAAITTETLDRWEAQLESLFAGRPFDDLDVALVYLERFPLDIQPFRDMIAGQQMDLYRSRYETFEELTFTLLPRRTGLMSTAVMGVIVLITQLLGTTIRSLVVQPKRRSPWELPTSSPISCEMWGKMHLGAYLPYKT